MNIRGAFSEYVVQEASLVFRYPSTIAPEAICTLPFVSVTAALGLFHEMRLPLPPAKFNCNFLVWAGSTSVGQCVIQLAKSIGCYVITTASPARHAYLKELGADVCFDYRDPDIVARIKEAANYNLAYAFDCISEKDSTMRACDALTTRDAHLVTVLPFITNVIPAHITEHRILVYTIFTIERLLFGQLFVVKPQDKAFAEMFYKLLSDLLLPTGRLKPNRVTKMPGGLNGVEEGFKRMMENKVSAEKLVYTIAETDELKDSHWLCCSFNS